MNAYSTEYFITKSTMSEFFAKVADIFSLLAEKSTITVYNCNTGQVVASVSEIAVEGIG